MRELQPPLMEHAASSSAETLVEHESTRKRPRLHSLDVSDPHAYFVSEDTNFKLAGVDVFSPAASRPPSPVARKQQLQYKPSITVTDTDNVIGGDGLSLRRKSNKKD